MRTMFFAAVTAILLSQAAFCADDTKKVKLDKAEFSLVADKRLDALEAKIDGLTKAVEALSKAKAAGDNCIPPCKCGCVETGVCKCKNCNDHTADLTKMQPPVANTAPSVPPLVLWRAADGSLFYAPAPATVPVTGGGCVGGNCPRR